MNQVLTTSRPWPLPNIPALPHSAVRTHTHTHWPAQSLFRTAAVFIYTPSSIQRFYTMTKCLDGASACNHSVCTCWKRCRSAATSRLQVSLTEMEGDFILSLALTAQIKTEICMELSAAENHLDPVKAVGRWSFRRGERPRVASAWKFMNLQQSLVHLSHKSTLNLLLIISILYFLECWVIPFKISKVF